MGSFNCEKLSAILDEKTCAQRYKSGNFAICSACTTGVMRTGEKQAINLKNTCSRCQKTAQRLIYQRLCLSCYNREREAEKGFDRRGNPKKAIEKISVNCDSGVFQETAKTMNEVLIDLVRNGVKFVHFNARIYQNELFS